MRSVGRGQSCHRWIPVALVGLLGCYAHHEVPRTTEDAGPADARTDTRPEVGVCDLSAVECTALPGCVGASPPETLYCDDVRICLFSDPGDEMATAIAAVADRIRCDRADSCDFLCSLEVGPFDDEVRRELCDIARVAPEASIGCAIYGP